MCTHCRLVKDEELPPEEREELAALARPAKKSKEDQAQDRAGVSAALNRTRELLKGKGASASGRGNE